MKHVVADDHRAIIEHTSVMLWRCTPDGQLDFANTAWLEFAGRDLPEELDDGWTERIHPDDVGWYLERHRARVQRREPYDVQIRLRRADGQYRHVRVDLTPLTHGADGFQGFLGSAIDLDEREAQEADAAAAEFFESSIDHVCVAEFDGYFRRVSASWTRTLGWTSEELLSRPILDFVHPDDREGVIAARNRLQQGAELELLVNRYLTRDGSHRWFEWRSVARRGCVYAVARDITEQRVAAERLREVEQEQENLRRQLIFADRMASVGTLAAGIAHEINNPLAYVTTNIALLLDELAEIEAPADRLERMTEMAADAHAGAERIRKIVRTLKTLSRAEEERRGVVELRPLIEMSINMTVNEIRHRGRLVEDYGDVPPVEADDARLGQVFINLLVNAAQALPEHDDGRNEIRVTTSTAADGSAVVEVRDTGAGIPESEQARIFDPFFTTKPVGIGTGLGLSICHNIVTSLGGEISVSSEEGEGTTFRVVLPAAKAPVTHDEAPEAPVVDLACAAVLVVDDEPAVGMVLSRVLRDHEVTVVTSATEALSLLDAGQRFHIIFSDLMMPGMSGIDFYGELETRYPEIVDRVVFVSGGAFTPRAQAFLEKVSNDTLDKPFTPTAAREFVQRYAERAGR